MLTGGGLPGSTESGQQGAAQQHGFANPTQTSPFYIQTSSQLPQLVTTASGQLQPLAPAAGVAGSRTVDASHFQPYLSAGSTSSSVSLGGSYNVSLQDVQNMSSVQLGSQQASQQLYIEVGPAGNPIVLGGFPQQFHPQAASSQQQQQQRQQQPQLSSHSGQQTAPAQRNAAASKPKQRPKRPYKPPQQVAQERKLKEEANDYIRRLEQQLGKARAELERLQRENTTLQRKSFVLSKHSSFRRCAAEMLQELQQSMTLGHQLVAMDSSQRVLDAAEKGLPEPAVLEYLRRMTTEEAVQFYNGVVAKVRQLLHQLDNGPGADAAQRQLEDIFALKDKASTFGYLGVVNPPVYAELMQAKLDPASPVDRNDPAHWHGVLAAMALTEEQESQLILLLQSYLKQAEQIMQRKSLVMQQLADELSQDLLSLELSQDGSSGDVAVAPEADSGSSAAGSDDSRRASQEGGDAPQTQHDHPTTSPRVQQAKDELDRLLQIEYWLKFDFTGCIRKLLPAQQQALCMVHSWPFYPDQRQIEAALRQKAGPLWDQLARSAS